MTIYQHYMCLTVKIKFYGAIDLTDLIVAREYVVLETLVTTSYPLYTTMKQ